MADGTFNTGYTEIPTRPNDKQRQDAVNTGVGDFGGINCEEEEIIQKTMTTAETT